MCLLDRTHQGARKTHALRCVLSLPLDPHSLSALRWGCLRRTGALPLTPTRGAAPGPRLGHGPKNPSLRLLANGSMVHSSGTDVRYLCCREVHYSPIRQEDAHERPRASHWLFHHHSVSHDTKCAWIGAVHHPDLPGPHPRPGGRSSRWHDGGSGGGRLAADHRHPLDGGCASSRALCLCGRRRCGLPAGSRGRSTAT
jgi:hypothetical protein